MAPSPVGLWRVCRYKTVDGHFCYHDFCMDLDQSVRTQIEKNLAAAGVKEEKSLHVPLSDQDEKILQKAGTLGDSIITIIHTITCCKS